MELALSWEVWLPCHTPEQGPAGSNTVKRVVVLNPHLWFSTQAAHGASGAREGILWPLCGWLYGCPSLVPSQHGDT